MNKPLTLIFALSLLAALSPAQDMKADASKNETPNGAMMSIDPSKAVFNLKGLAPGILPFSSEAAAQAAASKKRVVYFFAASWCPTCREAYRDLKTNAKSVPKDLMILVVDYDKSMALKAAYGVTTQHTFVSIGPKGEKLKIWSGSKTLKEIDREAVRL